ncbi:DUF3772 domain-containing protein [Rhodovulum sp. DZ06]|uniref:DUF3772 domain-containing protein n=1 Tax=Rhodovulum sp. DZ06 TaxID=3425126 RepID=UPI003D352D5C
MRILRASSTAALALVAALGVCAPSLIAPSTGALAQTAETAAPAPAAPVRGIATGQGGVSELPAAAPLEAIGAAVEEAAQAAAAEAASPTEIVAPDADAAAETDAGAAASDAAATPADAAPADAATAEAPSGGQAGTQEARAAAAEEAAAEAEAAAQAAAPTGPPTEAELAEVLSIAAASNPALSEERTAEVRARIKEWEASAARAADAVNEGRASTPAMELLRERLTEDRAAATELARQARVAGDPLRAQLEALGPAPENGEEPRETAAERQTLETLIAQLDSRARQGDLAAARADALISQIDGLIRDRFAEQLATRGPTPFNPAAWTGALEGPLDFAHHVAGELTEALNDPVRQKEREARVPLFIAAVLLALGIGVFARRRVVAALERAAPEDAGRGRLVAVGALIAVTRLIAPAAALALCYFGLIYGDFLGRRGIELLNYTAMGLGVLIAGHAIGRAYYSPSAPRFRHSVLGDAEASRGAICALGLGTAYAADQILVGAGEAFGYSQEVLAVLNLCVLLFGAVFMWGLAGLVAPKGDAAKAEADKPGEDDIAAYQRPADEDEAPALGRRLLKLGSFFMRAVALGSVAASLAGYFAASRYAFFPTVMTVGLLAAGVLLFTMIRDGVEGYLSDGDEGEAGGAEGAPAAGGLRLIPIFAGFVIILALLPELALIWGARPADLGEAWGVISGGIQMGESRIAPVDFLTFALVFLAVYTIMRLLQSVLRRSVLPNTRLDSGARNAIASFAGYAGFAIAALSAISAAGLDLSSLAIVAGALSVGIGFGLQNVVNNFVSGIILLVERPIKVGDWIVVNGTHGTVKKISVRATEIETFDRAAYIVPNGDLISSPVMNMTHGNNVGRLMVPVGVAYGADVEKVRDILEEVSTTHSAVLRYPAPQILFLEFGADSLNFEIRCILRDIGQVLAVKSHMHFEIERRFREAGIEIPFAQRDLHVRNPEALGSAIGKGVVDAMETAFSAGAAPVSGGGTQGGGGAPLSPARPAAPKPPETDPRPVGERGPDQDGDADGDGEAGEAR